MTSDFSEVRRRLNQIVEQSISELSSMVRENGQLTEDDHYGRAFFLALLRLRGEAEDTTIDKLSLSYLNHPGPEKTAHHEFVRLAIHFANDPFYGTHNMPKLEAPSEFRGTRVANWIALRALVLQLDGKCFASTLLFHVVRVIFTNRGFIYDDYRGYSLQYHIFTTAVVAHSLRRRNRQSKSLENWLSESIDRILDLTCSGTDDIFFGRGALQIFGYSSLAWLFSHTNVKLDRGLKRNILESSISRLEEALENTPSNLVVNGRPEGSGSEVDLQSPHFVGWWSYNSRADYLAFSATLAQLSMQNLEEMPIKKAVANSVSGPKSRKLPLSMSVTVEGEKRYFVTTPNNRIWAAAVPLPRIMGSQVQVFPILGGEQRQLSSCGKESYPLPISQSENIFFVHAKYRWVKKLTYSGRIGKLVHRRHFSFTPNSFSICDTLTAGGRDVLPADLMFPRLLFLRERILAVTDDRIDMEGGISVSVGSPCDLQSAGTCPEGELVALVLRTSDPRRTRESITLEFKLRQ